MIVVGFTKTVVIYEDTQICNLNERDGSDAKH